MKIQLWLFILIYALQPHPLMGMDNSTNTNLHIIGWTAAIIGTRAVAHLFNESNFLNRLEASTNIDFRDITSTCTLASTLLGVSHLFSNDRGTKIRHFALRFPIASLVAKIITSKATKQASQHIPVLNWYLGCPNSQCSGQCNSCGLRNMLVFAGIIRMIV